MFNIDNFHYLLGQTLMYCQIIENDIKLIYAIMLNANIEKTLNQIENEKWTMGQTLNVLKKLDYSDKSPYLSINDYNYLHQIVEKRNHWCHKSYINFIYNDSFENSKEYEKECKKLYNDNEQLSNVYKKLEKVRLQALKDFNRC